MMTFLLRKIVRRLARTVHWTSEGGVTRAVRRAPRLVASLPTEAANAAASVRNSNRLSWYVASSVGYTSLAAVGGPHLALLLLLTLAAAFDLWQRRIYNAITVPALIVALSTRLVTGGLDAFLAGLAGFALGFGALLLLWLLGGMGGGDVKLMGAVGAYLGWTATFHVLLLASVLGALGAIVMVLVQGRVRRTASNLFWTVVALVLPGVRPSIPTENASYIPFGVAIAVGAVLVTWNPEQGALATLLAALPGGD